MSRSFEKSREWLRRSSRRIPGCAQTFSKAPISFVQGVAPSFLSRAKGAYVWDVDGNRYIDFILGLGPAILGHSDDAVNAAIREQLEAGTAFSLPHPVEVELAELLCEIIPCAEMVRFGKNGSDVTAAAVRVSRAYTGRDLVARCGYHGWQDWYIGSTNRNLGVPGAVRSLTLRFPYNDSDALRRVFEEHPGAIACVIMEPVTFDVPKPGYLEDVRELCHQQGALLVFDEIVTGFRIGLGGAQQHFGVTPDLACFGKAMANGLPISAIVGRAEIMSLFEQVFFSGTFGGETASMAAAAATIRALQERDGIAVLWKNGAFLQQSVRELLAANNLADSFECVGLPPWTSLRLRGRAEEEALALRSYFQQECLRRGILTHGSHMLSLTHDQTVLDEALIAYAEIFPLLAQAIRDGDVLMRLEGPALRPIIRAER
jgi:glutamate-1-semialdehyde 2,1-aminomutase/spore coat polysaccharide biosynthesis protein SpsF